MGWTVSCKKVYEMACNAREEIWKLAKAQGREPKIYLHWTAGNYNNVYDEYHLNIIANGSIYATTDNLADILAHTYHRNSGAVGITLCCCFEATPKYLGPESPTSQQIESMAQCIAAVAEGLWLTIDKQHVLTHGEAGDNIDGLSTHEKYGPLTTCERWDLQYLGTAESPRYLKDYDNPATGGNVLRGKANWYKVNKEWRKDVLGE